MKLNYSLSTDDAESAHRLIAAAAGLGTFKLIVTEIKELTLKPLVATPAIAEPTTVPRRT